MYDYPLSSSSSSTPPSPLPTRKQHRRRSQSPLPHLATLLPTPAHNHHHHQYSPSTRAADISRLLDPCYASSSSSSSMCPTPSPQSQTRAYVDHNGDLHDPDYRDFPVLRSSARSSTTPKPRRTSASSATRSRSHDRHSIAMYPTRPNWERDWATEIGDSDDENEDDELESQSHFNPFASQHGSSRKHSSHNAHKRVSHPPSNYHYYTDMPVTSSPMGSYEDESPNALQLHESPFGDDDDEIVDDLRKSTSLIRKVSKPKRAMSVEVETEKDSEEPSPMLRSLDEEHDEHATTPTCTHVLRQQWQAVTLRIRFGVFHAKRRLSTRRRT